MNDKILNSAGKIIETLNAVVNYAVSVSETANDFKRYFNTDLSVESIKKHGLAYIFARNVNGVSMSEFFLSQHPEFPHADVINALSKSFFSVFKVKKVSSFEAVFENLINEKTYNVCFLSKVADFRKYSDGFVYARLCKYNDVYFVCEIKGFSGSDKEFEALNYAVSRLIAAPEELYFDNPSKLKEIKKTIAALKPKFLEFFGADEVVTANNNADILIGLFNEWCETSNPDLKKEVSKYINLPANYAFSGTSKFTFNPQNVAGKTLEGFSSDREEYDVAVIFDETAGLFAIPYYGLVSKILSTDDDYTSISGYKDCVLNFMKNPKIPFVIFKRIKDKYPDCMKRLSEILGEKMTLKHINEKFKDKKSPFNSLSPASILYTSRSFSKLMTKQIKKDEISSELQDVKIPEKIGRNDPCPCGSGKKYKKCCMLKLQALKA